MTSAARGTPATPSLPSAASRRFASSWIQPVTSVSAGPPLGGLYLKPPSSGGLCDGVTTIPSASPRPAAAGASDGGIRRPRFATRIAWYTAGVGGLAGQRAVRHQLLATPTSPP